jgi:hypothetical protein
MARTYNHSRNAEGALRCNTKSRSGCERFCSLQTGPIDARRGCSPQQWRGGADDRYLDGACPPARTLYRSTPPSARFGGNAIGHGGSKATADSSARAPQTARLLLDAPPEIGPASSSSLSRSSIGTARGAMARVLATAAAVPAASPMAKHGGMTRLSAIATPVAPTPRNQLDKGAHRRPIPPLWQTQT